MHLKNGISLKGGWVIPLLLALGAGIALYIALGNWVVALGAAVGFYLLLGKSLSSR